MKIHRNYKSQNPSRVRTKLFIPSSILEPHIQNSPKIPTKTQNSIDLPKLFEYTSLSKSQRPTKSRVKAFSTKIPFFEGTINSQNFEKIHGFDFPRKSIGSEKFNSSCCQNNKMLKQKITNSYWKETNYTVDLLREKLNQSERRYLSSHVIPTNAMKRCSRNHIICIFFSSLL